MLELVSLLAFGAGLAFFAAGTAGVLRFGDTVSRVHAVAKADNLGLGLVAIAVALRADSAAEVVRLVGIWGGALVASAAACHLIAREVGGGGSAPEPGPEDG